MKRKYKFSTRKKNLLWKMKHPFLVLGGFFVLASTILFFFWHQFFLEFSKSVPAEGGIYTESTIGNIKNLNPFSKNQSLFDKDLHKLIFAGLLQYNPITEQIESGLAEFKIGNDPKVYELTLKNSAKFSDGKNVTIEDVLFTFEEIIQNTNFSNKNIHDAFEYIQLKVIDEKTISFVLPEQNSFFASLLTIPILPKKYFKEVLIEEITDPDLPFNKKPIGAGPFKLENIVPNDDGSFRVFLKKNPHFYGGKPLLDQLVFYVYPNLETLQENKKETTSFSQIPFGKDAIFETELLKKYSYHEFLLPRFTGLFFNLDKKTIDSPYFRKALYYAFEGEKILENGWERINSPFFFEKIETNYHTTDFIEARKLLRDHGFPFNKTKKLRTYGKNGDKIKLNFITSTQPAIYSRMAQNIVRTWEKELDIELNLEILKPEDFQKALQNRDYDIVLFGQNFSNNFDTLSLWHSSQSGKLNLSNLTRDDTDFLIDEIRFSGASSDWFSLSEKLDEIMPAIIFTTPKYNLFTSKELFSFDESFGKIRNHSDRFSHIENWHFFKKNVWDWSNDKSKFIVFWKWIFKH